MLKKLVYQRFKTHGAAAELVYKLPLQTSGIISGEVINTCLAPLTHSQGAPGVRVKFLRLEGLEQPPVPSPSLLMLLQL